jgi:hypothetical protein
MELHVDEIKLLEKINFNGFFAQRIIGLTKIESEILQRSRLYGKLTLKDIYYSTGKINNMFARWYMSTTFREVRNIDEFEFRWTETDPISGVTTKHIASCVRGFYSITEKFITDNPDDLIEGLVERCNIYKPNGDVAELNMLYVDGKRVHRRLFGGHGAYVGTIETITDETGKVTILSDRITEQFINKQLKIVSFESDRPDCATPKSVCHIRTSISGTHYLYQPANGAPHYKSFDNSGALIESVGAETYARRMYVMPDKHLQVKRQITARIVQDFFYEIDDDNNIFGISYKVKEIHSPKTTKSDLIILNKIM